MEAVLSQLKYNIREEVFCDIEKWNRVAGRQLADRLF